MQYESDGDRRPTMSIVAPMYNEAANVAAFVERVTSTLAELGVSFEIIIVDDGSRDGTWDQVAAAAKDDHRVRGVRLSRNFGHQKALLCGMHLACGDCVVTMDGDLQHPPEVILRLFDRWKDGKYVVNTKRLDSEDTGWFKRRTSRWFYRLFSALSGLPVEPGSSDFRLVDRRVLGAIRDVRDVDIFLRGVIQWVGFPAVTVEYRAHNRHSGTTKYTLAKMLRFAIAGMVSFSVIPLKLGILAGLVTAFLAVSEIIYVIVIYAQGLAVPGWASIVIFMSVMFAVLFLLLGIMGQYLASIFEIMKNRPRYIVQEEAHRRQAGSLSTSTEMNHDPAERSQ